MSKMTCADCPGGTDFEQRAANLQARIERVEALATEWEEVAATGTTVTMSYRFAAKDLRIHLSAPTGSTEEEE